MPTQPTTSSTKAPGPKGTLLFGNLADFRRDTIGFLTHAARQYGDVVRFRFGPMIVHLINHPDHIERILHAPARQYDKQTHSVSKIRATCGESLLTTDGDAWLRHRRLMQPAFQPLQLKRFLPVITDATSQMLDRWNLVAASGEPLDVVSEMMRLVMTIAARTLFGVDVSGDAEVIERSLAIILNDTWRRLEAPIDLTAISGRFHRKSFRQALSEIHRVVSRIITARQTVAAPSDDLLSTLVRAGDTEGDRQFTHRELRDETVTLLLAGHETTANALAWAFYLLSQSPEVESQLHDDTSRVLGGDALQPEHVDQLIYADALFAETIRLYPSIWVMERRAVQEDVIGGYRIPAGSTVLISPYILHRDPRFWSDPDAFDPTRFTERDDETRPRSAYIPFGAGPHQCIGRHMAELISRVILSMVSQRFRLRLVEGQNIVPQPGITLRHPHGLRMIVSAR